MSQVKTDRFTVAWHNGTATLIIPVTPRQANNARQALQGVKHVRFTTISDDNNVIKVQTTLRKGSASTDRLNRMYSTIMETLRNPGTRLPQPKRQQFRSKTGPYRRLHRGTLRTLLPTT